MSWGIQKIVGTVEKVRAAAAEAFDNAAKYYEGKTEGDDVKAAKARVLAWLDDCKLTEGYGVMVEASGSQGANGSTAWLNLKIECSTVKLA